MLPKNKVLVIKLNYNLKYSESDDSYFVIDYMITYKSFKNNKL